jgi:hypothetical protein
MIPSSEQKNIISLLQTNNITVDSCAGAGKTSSVIFIAEAFSDKNILVLTYNAALKCETRGRSSHLKNLNVDSYHSFCTSNYDRAGYVDNVLNNIIKEDASPFGSINYDIIVVDEAQDMNPLYYRLVCKILSDNSKKMNVKIIIMGDKMQSIYKFRDADPRFITFSQKLFSKYSDASWIDANLSETFRCTIPMTAFINDCVLGYTRVKSSKKSAVKPNYMITNSYGVKIRIVLEDYLKTHKPSDIFVLAYSIKDMTPIKTLANWVTNNTNVPIFCSGSDQESLDSRVIDGKIVFTTFHQSKGRQRPVVIVFGFDASYFKYYDKTSDHDICPNELYVAITRASERLTVVHDMKNEMLPFIRPMKLKQLTNFTDDSKKKVPTNKGISFKEQSFTVSELVSYLSFNIENECMECITVKDIKTAGNKIDIPNVVKIGELYESVSDITGISIPSYFEYTIKGSTTILNKNLVENHINSINLNNWSEDAKLVIITKLKKLSKTLNSFYEENIKNIDITKSMNIDELLKISLYYSCQQNRTDYKLKQITKFDWITQKILDEGIKRLTDVIGNEKELCFEESVEKYYDKIQILGEIDCIDHACGIVYELKCTKTLTMCHIIQLMLYAYIYKRNYTYRLFNILTDELIEVSASNENLEKMVGILIGNKLSTRESMTDTEFLGSVS